MPLTTVGELRTEIADWAERSDLSDNRLNSFVTLTESYVNRVLRVPSMEWRALVSSTEGRLLIPFDYLELRNIAYIGTADSQDRYDLEASTFEQVNTHRLLYNDTVPTLYARQGNFWFVASDPGDDKVFEIRYYRFLTALDDVNQPDNWLLQVAPEVYLFGGLYFLYMFLQDETKAAYWQKLFDDAIARLQKQGDDSDGGAHGRVRNLDRMGSEI